MTPSATSPDSRGRLADRTVDPFLGPVIHLAELQGDGHEPRGLYAYTATLADLQPFLAWRPDLQGSGFNFDRRAALSAAIGEAMERYSGNFIRTDWIRTATFHQLREGTESALDPTSLYPFRVGHSNSIDARFAQPGHDSELGWTRMEVLQTGRDVWIPAALVYLNYYTSVTTEPRHFPVMLPGIAAGETRGQALTAAVLEVLERDATALWWSGRVPATAIEIDRGLDQEICPPNPARFTSKSLLLRSYDSGIPAYVVAHLLIDKASSTIQVGFACRFDLRAAILKAAAEAWQLRRLNEALLDPDSWVWAMRPDGRRPLPLHPFDPTRQYDELGDTPFANMTQLVHNLQYYLNPQRQEAATALFMESGADGEESSVLGRDGRVDLSSIDFGRLAQTESLNLYFADLTTLDVGDLGVHVCRVLAPQACPNLPAAFPPLNNARLRAASNENCAGDLNLSPLPHA